MLEKPRGKRTTKYKGAPEEATSRTVSLVPMNDNQKLYIDALSSHQQIIVLGPSGTGKTYIAASYAANLYILRKIDKIIITRPAVSVGKSLGALPGDIGEKFSPWLSPVLSVLEEQLGKGVVECTNGCELFGFNFNLNFGFYDFITPNFWNERCCGGCGYRWCWICHD